VGVGAGLYIYDVVVKSSRSLSHPLMSFLLKAAASTAVIALWSSSFHGYKIKDGLFHLYIVWQWRNFFLSYLCQLFSAMM